MSKFWDMELRVVNAASNDDFRIEFRDPGGCWPYGRLYLYEELGQRYALFGDLRIQVTVEESLRLCEIAELRRTGAMPQLDKGKDNLAYCWETIRHR